MAGRREIFDPAEARGAASSQRVGGLLRDDGRRECLNSSCTGGQYPSVPSPENASLLEAIASTCKFNHLRP